MSRQVRYTPLFLKLAFWRAGVLLRWVPLPLPWVTVWLGHPCVLLLANRLEVTSFHPHVNILLVIN